MMITMVMSTMLVCRHWLMTVIMFLTDKVDGTDGWLIVMIMVIMVLIDDVHGTYV